MVQSFEKQYVLRLLREFFPRSVPLCRSTNEVLMVVLTVDHTSQLFNNSIVPNTIVFTILTTRPFVLLQTES